MTLPAGLDEAMKSLKSLFLFTLLVVLPLVVYPVTVWAHGIGTPQQLNVPAGPYLLSIWSDPNPLRVNETHITVAIMNPETRMPIVAGVGATVQLQSPTDPAVRRTAVASPDNTANKLLYAAVFNDLPEPGLWQGVVSVTGPDGPGEDVAIEVEVLPAPPVNWRWLGIVTLVGVVLGWAVWSRWRRQPQPQPLKRRGQF